jgi:hypothetical protein
LRFRAYSSQRSPLYQGLYHTQPRLSNLGFSLASHLFDFFTSGSLFDPLLMAIMLRTTLFRCFFLRNESGFYHKPRTLSNPAFSPYIVREEACPPSDGWRSLSLTEALCSHPGEPAPAGDTTHTLLKHALRVGQRKRIIARGDDNSKKRLGAKCVFFQRSPQPMSRDRHTRGLLRAASPAPGA